MLLIKNNQTERSQRQKHSGARAHHNKRIVAFEAMPPGTNTLAGGAAAVILKNLISESLTATIHELGNEPDLRSEQQSVATGYQLCSCQLQIDLGLAGAGDAPQQ